MDSKLLVLVCCSMIFVTGQRIIDRNPCSKHVTIPIGGEALIACPWDKEAGLIVWYKGTSQSAPILQWVDGEAGGSENNSEHYKIAEDGSMIILNASGEQGGHYIVLTIFKDYTFERTGVFVVVSHT